MRWLGPDPSRSAPECRPAARNVFNSIVASREVRVRLFPNEGGKAREARAAIGAVTEVQSLQSALDDTPDF